MDAPRGCPWLRRLAACTLLTATAAGLLLAVSVVIPGLTERLFYLGLRVEAQSLRLAALVVPGAALALLVRSAGAPRVAGVAGTGLLLTLLLALLPAAQSLSDARSQEVTLALLDRFSEPPLEDLPDETHTFGVPGSPSEGLQLDVWLPPDQLTPVTRSAVVLVHGGGWSSGERGGESRWAQWLSARGHLVFDVDYRLAPPPRWQDAVGDVKCALGWLHRNAPRYKVDPHQLALMGHSAGGHLALLAAYSTGDPALPPSCSVPDIPVAAVAAFYPITELTILDGQDSPWLWAMSGSSNISDFLGGSPHQVPFRARITSPAARPVATMPPTYLVHGTADQVVPVAQSRLLASRWGEDPGPHRYVELTGANHLYDGEWTSWRAQITRVTLGRFLDAHLPAVGGSRPS